eukprot:TRINITY_DN743_c1_g1_i3.p1 TRINITY_DN743_c1_g1~~TRINITY_DN743_c1_g1_i3.p1  ORF type:complete len:218 (-),score=65.68 TRINITY_DN743_c1_g1_i3:83-736(-)
MEREEESKTLETVKQKCFETIPKNNLIRVLFGQVIEADKESDADGIYIEKGHWHQCGSKDQKENYEESGLTEKQILKGRQTAAKWAQEDEGVEMDKTVEYSQNLNTSYNVAQDRESKKRNQDQNDSKPNAKGQKKPKISATEKLNQKKAAQKTSSAKKYEKQRGKDKDKDKEKISNEYSNTHNLHSSKIGLIKHYGDKYSSESDSDIVRIDRLRALS